MRTSDTSDERRKVAERLGAGGIARNVREAYVLLLHCVGIRPQLPADKTYQEALSRIADLIDPTCHDFGGQEGTNGEGYDFACSACGWRGDVCGPRYCPGCGARVVEEELRHGGA